jgi:hypothetical protein
MQGEAMATEGNNVTGEECWEYGPNSELGTLHSDEERLLCPMFPDFRKNVFLESSYASPVRPSAKSNI